MFLFFHFRVMWQNNNWNEKFFVNTIFVCTTFFYTGGRIFSAYENMQKIEDGLS